MLSKSVRRAIQEFEDHVRWQDFCLNYLAGLDRYRGIIPTNRKGQDGGADGLRFGKESIAFHITLDKNTEKKFKDDLGKTKNLDCNTMVFVTNQELTPSLRVKIFDLADKKNIVLDVHDINRIVAEVCANRHELMLDLELPDSYSFVKNRDVLPVLVADTKLAKAHALAEALNGILSPGSEVKVAQDEDGKPKIAISKLMDVVKDVKGTLKIKLHEKGFESPEEFLNYLQERLKNGDDYIVLSDEIEDFTLESGEVPLDFSDIQSVRVSPIPTKGLINCDLSIPSIGFSLREIPFGMIKDGEGNTILRSYDYPIAFKFLVPDEKAAIGEIVSYTFSLDPTVRDLNPALTYFSLWNFCQQEQELIIKRSSDLKVLFMGRLHQIKFPHKNWLDILVALQVVSARFGVQFEYPTKMDSDDVNNLYILRDLIQQGTASMIMDEFTTHLTEEDYNRMCALVDKDGVLKEVDIYNGNSYFRLLGVDVPVENIWVHIASAEFDPNSGEVRHMEDGQKYISIILKPISECELRMGKEQQ